MKNWKILKNFRIIQSCKDKSLGLDNGNEVLPFGTKPDLSQNDPNAADYVKNRTHYEETKNVVIADEHDIRATLKVKSTISGYSQNGYLHGDKIILGESYIVTFDGIDYVGVARKDSNDTPYLFGVEGGGIDDTEAPIQLYVIPANNQVACMIGNGSNHTIKITHVQKHVKKLDKKFLPDNIGGGGGSSKPLIIYAIPTGPTSCYYGANMSFTEAYEIFRGMADQPHPPVIFSGMYAFTGTRFVPLQVNRFYEDDISFALVDIDNDPIYLRWNHDGTFERQE